MLRLLPITLLLTLCLAATAHAATVKVPVPPEGQITVATATVAKKSSVRAKAPTGIVVTGAAKKGRLAVAVVHRRGVVAGGRVTLKVKGRLRGLRIGGAPACKGLGALLPKPLVRGGLGAADLRALGAATAAKLCGKPFSQAVFDRLGLGAEPSTSGGISRPGGGGPSPPTDGGGGSSGATNQCSNGIDDDGDGQVDAPSERRLRPDPGCMNGNDPTEAGEVPLTCDATASRGAEPSELKVEIGDGCGSFVEAAVYAAPSAFVCDITASAGNWVCVIAHGQPWAETRNATDADRASLTIGLNGAADCAVPVTIVLTRRAFEVAELVTPIAGCGQAAPECSNGVDDDDDGIADAREFGTDPDPGCASPADTSEDSEIGLPAGCTVAGGEVGQDPRFPGIEVSGCGSVTAVWFKPSAMPSDCVFAIGAGGGQACTVTGATAGAAFAPTTSPIVLATHTATLPPCAPVTVAVTLADGRVAKLRAGWC
jgi:hypothetical protein